MKRVFIPIEAVTISHVVRPLQIAKRLREKGVEVIFGCVKKYHPLIEDAGFEVHELFSQDPKITMKEVRDYSLKTFPESLRKALEADLALMKQLAPIDLVFSDLRWTARLAAEHLGIRFASMMNGYFSPYYEVLPEVPDKFSSFMPAFVRRSVAFRRFLKNLIPRIYRYRFIEPLKRKFGLKSRIDRFFDILVSDELTLICDIPEFTPQKNLPPHFHFVGPIPWEPDDSKATAIPREFDGKRRPLIYLTLGTSGSEETLHPIIQLLEKAPYDVVISTGGENLHDLPSNMFSAPFVKASDVLSRASLMICHGGNGTIYQAIEHEVPLFCISTFYDQEWNSQRVKELGLGQAVFHENMKKIDLLAHLQELTENPNYRQNLKKFKTLLALWKGPEFASQKIIEFLAAPRKAS